MSAVNEDLITRVDRLRRVIIDAASGDISSAIIGRLVDDLASQVLRLREDRLVISDAAAPGLQRYLYEAPEIAEIISVCNLVVQSRVSFSTEGSFPSDQVKRNAIAAANGFSVRQIFIVPDWIEVIQDAALVRGIQSLLHARAEVRILETDRNDDSSARSFTLFGRNRSPSVAFVAGDANASANEQADRTITTSEAGLSTLVTAAEALWQSALAFDIRLI